jgi:hypothetical protein
LSDDPNWLQRDVELRRLSDEAHVLEGKAGITAAMERAREGQFMPDLNATSEEYHASHHDAVRDMTRDAYFGVPDVGLRMQLIALHRKGEKYRKEMFEAEVFDTTKALGVAEEKATRNPTFRSALFMAAGAIAGGIGYGVLGAILGIPAGLFFAKWHAQEQMTERKGEIDRIKRDLAFHQESVEELANRPEFFSYGEESTGVRDEGLDQESAYFNLLEHVRTQR